MMVLLYSIIAEIAYMTIKLLSFFDKWAKRLINGRKNLIKDVKNSINPNEDIAWFHCASLGEFEQVKELIESFKQKYPSYRILITFFSPSGYEARKSYEKADYVFYIPIDTYDFARNFVMAINPKIVIIVKYEFWVNLIMQIKKNGAELILVSAIFNKKNVFFKWYGGLFRKTLKNFDKIFVQDLASQKLLEGVGINNSVVTGDTRFDRVYKESLNQINLPIIENFCAGKKAVIFGSTWGKDNRIAINFIKNNPEERVIVAPHKINQEVIDNLFKSIQTNGVTVTKYSCAGSISPSHKYNVILIDNIGLLSKIYKYGKFAHIGGGFSAGIHNTLEAATFGLPISFGPNYHKFNEAKNLIALNAAKSITKYQDLQQWFDKLNNDKELYEKTSETEKEYIRSSIGACEMILEWVSKSHNSFYK